MSKFDRDRLESYQQYSWIEEDLMRINRTMQKAYQKMDEDYERNKEAEYEQSR